MPLPRAARASNPLPSGTATVGLGLIVSGVLTYVFLAIARRSLDDDAYSAFAVVWGLVFIVGPGLFQPLEQEIARATAQRMTLGKGARPIARRAAEIGAIGLLAASLVAAVGWPLGLDELLDDSFILLGALIGAFGGFMALEVIRGVLGGTQRFGAYSRSLAVEGGTRFVGAAAVAALGVGAPGWFGGILAGSFFVAAVAGALGRSAHLDDGPDASWRDVSPALGLLLTTSLSEAFLLNVGPAAVAVLADDEAAAGRFLSALVIARLPLFVFQAVKVSLLPAVSTAAAQGDLPRVRRTVMRLLAVTAGLAAAAVVGTALLGPFFVELLFVDVVQRLDVTLLAAANGTAMIAITLSISLIGIGRARTAATWWIVGVATFCASLLPSSDAMVRVESAMLAAFAVIAVGMGWSLRPVWFALSEPRATPSDAPDVVRSSDRHLDR
jgi:O-antigen/teichoic acid export membrane protein